MPITYLDIILLVVMMISALLAMVRGFMREVLSIASWIAAAAVTLYSLKRLLPVAKQYINNDYLAYGVVIGGTFLGTLLVVAVISVKISDTILDSRVGALDRTLGFLFGLGRGLVIVVVAYVFYAWLASDKNPQPWIRDAKSLAVLQSTGNWMKGLLQEVDSEGLINKLLKQRKLDDQEQSDAPTGNRTQLDGPDRHAVTVRIAYAGYHRLMAAKPQ